MAGVIPRLRTTDATAPTAGQLAVGEIAFNAVSGILYAKRQDASVQPVTAGLLTLVGAQFGDNVNAPVALTEADVRVPFAGTITRADIHARASASAVVDVLSSSDGIAFASIAASAKPTLAAAQSASDTTLTGWTVAVAAGTWLRFSLSSVSGSPGKLNVDLTISRT